MQVTNQKVEWENACTAIYALQLSLIIAHLHIVLVVYTHASKEPFFIIGTAGMKFLNHTYSWRYVLLVRVCHISPIAAPTTRYSPACDILTTRKVVRIGFT